MTQRSIQAGLTPIVVVRAGGDVTVAGWEGDRVLATTEGRWGLKVERRGDAIEVQLGGSGEVRAPLGSNVKVYAGKSAEVRDIQGSVTTYAGRDVRTRTVHTLVHASAGRAMDLECETVEGDDVKLEAGGDVRCHIRRLTDATLMISDLGGYWEGVIGDGRIKVRLKAGGDVTLVTDQEVVAQPPHSVVGTIERPADAGGEAIE
jgi:hypothetical protein